MATQLGGRHGRSTSARRDALTASQSDANSNLPGPGLQPLHAPLHVREQGPVGARHDGALRRAHHRSGPLHDVPEPHLQRRHINATFASLRQQTCPQSGGDATLAPIDAQTPEAFDNAYYQNLMSRQGLFHSDQELFNGGSQDALVKKYSGNAGMFAADFARRCSLTGAQGEVRLNCRKGLRTRRARRDIPASRARVHLLGMPVGRCSARLRLSPGSDPVRVVICLVTRYIHQQNFGRSIKFPTGDHEFLLCFEHLGAPKSKGQTPHPHPHPTQTQ
ncbi:hypothetical protein HU200_011426 [Digitaria exilis]|uniref:Plant heme peroxidase family profile domain-containing protein n=1 Tax=Digitaria exilis TaxID=1010633 RepID=A0A835FHJ1_9POAL|nr:hypothetical protein HU200_011426 [Digitaria exilis]